MLQFHFSDNVFLSIKDELIGSFNLVDSYAVEVGAPAPAGLSAYIGFWPGDEYLVAVKKQLATFAAEYDWEQYHTPKNLPLSAL